MEETLAKLHKYFPSLPKNALKIYKACTEIMRLLMIHGILSDIRWVVEVRIRLAGESYDSFISYMSSLNEKHLY